MQIIDKGTVNGIKYLASKRGFVIGDTNNIKCNGINNSDLDREFNTVQKKTSIEEVKDENGNPIEYIVRGSKRDQMNYVRKIYEVGNHNYLKNYGEVNPNEPVTFTKNNGDSVTLEAFPNESEKNPLMKPQSGITSISSETEGGMGLIKKTTISFTFLVKELFLFFRYYILCTLPTITTSLVSNIILLRHDYTIRRLR